MLKVRNKGVGFIGQIGTGWSIQYGSSPVTLGSGSGSVGSLSFTADCDSTSRFTIDNYLSVQHYFDDQTSRWLSTFDGVIRQIKTDGRSGDFEMVSLASALDVEGEASSNPSGQFQRAIEMPRRISYRVGTSTYYTGGFYQTVDGLTVWNARPIPIYDVTCDRDHFYVLAGGGHNGEVVLKFAVDGTFLTVWPVYSGTDDTTAPQGRYIAQADGYIWVAQVARDRVKQFTIDGDFQRQFGGAGTANGQFSTIGGIAVSDYGVGNVYVTDSAAGNVQWFSRTGTFLGKVGTQGTGAGNTVFNAPNAVSIDPYTEDVFVSDQNARVRQYSSNMVYIGQPMGSFDTTAKKSKAEFRAGNFRIGTCFDSNGTAYAIQEGRIYKFPRENTGWPSITNYGPRRSVYRWDTQGVADSVPPNKIACHDRSGIIFVTRSTDVIEQYAGSMGNLAAYLLYYVALATPNFPVRIQALNDTWQVNELAFIPWRGNVWGYLQQCCAATDNSVFMFEDKLYFTARNKGTFSLPTDTDATPITLDSQAIGKSVTCVNYNARRTEGEEVLYLAASEDRVISVGLNDFTYVTVEANTYPEYLRNPRASSVPADGKYTVVSKDNVLISPTSWEQEGGAIRASLGSRPGTILLTIQGPQRDVTIHEGPYKISDEGGNPTLSVMGAGLITNPEIVRVGSGASSRVTNREVAQQIDYPFAFNAKIAYTEATWAAYNTGTPHQRLTFTFSSRRSPYWQNSPIGSGGTAFLVNAIIEWQDAQYIVDSVEANAASIRLTCSRYTRAGKEITEVSPPRFEELWAAKKAGEFDAFWLGYTAQDINIAPLRNLNNL
jgi:hypothetical protein